MRARAPAVLADYYRDIHLRNNPDYPQVSERTIFSYHPLVHTTPNTEETGILRLVPRVIAPFYEVYRRQEYCHASRGRRDR